MKKLSIDFAQTSQKLMIPEEVYRRILNNSIAPTEQDLVQIATALAQNDFETVRMISHRLKGSFSNLRIMELRLTAENMEDLAKKEQDKTKIQVYLDQFEEYFEQLKAFLKG